MRMVVGLSRSRGLTQGMMLLRNWFHGFGVVDGVGVSVPLIRQSDCAVSTAAFWVDNLNSTPSRPATYTSWSSGPHKHRKPAASRPYRRRPEQCLKSACPREARVDEFMGSWSRLDWECRSR
jgi:hypothetical protein